MLGRIPTQGEVIPLKTDGWICTILAANQRCIERLKIERAPRPEQPEQEADRPAEKQKKQRKQEER